MNPNKAIHYLLDNDSTVDGIVSGAIFQIGNVTENQAPPYIMIQKISDVPFSHKDANDFFSARIQVNIFHDNFNSCNDLAVACMNALDRVRGTTNGIAIAEINFLNEVNLHEYFSDFEGLFHFAQDYDVVYTRGDS